MLDLITDAQPSPCVELDGQQQMGPARGHDAPVRQLRGHQHARQAGQHVCPDGRLGIAQRPVLPATGRSERGLVARPLVALVTRAVAVATITALGPMATLDIRR